MHHYGLKPPGGSQDGGSLQGGVRSGPGGKKSVQAIPIALIQEFACELPASQDGDDSVTGPPPRAEEPVASEEPQPGLSAPPEESPRPSQSSVGRTPIGWAIPLVVSESVAPRRVSRVTEPRAEESLADEEVRTGEEVSEPFSRETTVAGEAAEPVVEGVRAVRPAEAAAPATAKAVVEASAPRTSAAKPPLKQEAVRPRSSVEDSIVEDAPSEGASGFPLGLAALGLLFLIGLGFFFRRADRAEEPVPVRRRARPAFVVAAAVKASVAALPQPKPSAERPAYLETDVVEDAKAARSRWAFRLPGFLRRRTAAATLRRRAAAHPEEASVRHVEEPLLV